MTQEWKDDLKRMVKSIHEAPDRTRAKRRQVESFISEIAAPALEELAKALQECGRDVEVEYGTRDALLRVVSDEEGDEFTYEIRASSYRKRDFVFPVIPLHDPQGGVYRAEAHVNGRPLNEDVTDCGREALIRKILREYERYLKWHL